MDSHSLLIAGMLLVLFLLAGAWHVYENLHIAQKLRPLTHVEISQWIRHFAWIRTIQVLSTLACASLIILSYDMQSRQLKAQLASAKTETKAATPNVTSAVPTAQQPAAASPAAQAQTAAKPVVLTPAPQNVLDSALNDEPSVSPTQAMDELYNPEKTHADNQSDLDDIKKRYEDILVLYMFLKKCGKVQPEDYGTITSALQQEMMAVNAPIRLQYDILSASENAYKEIYAKSACSGGDIEALSVQYGDYIKLMASRLSGK